MANETTQQPPSRPWVKLHLAKQSESCGMPPYIVGILQQETPASYHLSNVIEAVPDESRTVGYRVEERKFSDYISRTYVYRVELLGMRPDIDEFANMEDYGGGLG